MTDEELVRLAKLGNKDAFGLLYSQHVPKLVSFLRQYDWESQDAWDSAHEAFVIALKKIMDLRDDTLFVPWMYTIARHVACSQRKKKREALSEYLERDDENFQAETIEALSERTVLMQALDKLPEKRRVVLMLHCWHDVSYQDLAFILETSVATLRVEKSQALDQLRKVLGATTILESSRMRKGRTVPNQIPRTKPLSKAMPELAELPIQERVFVCLIDHYQISLDEIAALWKTTAHLVGLTYEAGKLRLAKIEYERSGKSDVPRPAE
jgi:RNA polymerase sigma-70 factor (ECF subfamily)